MKKMYRAVLLLSAAIMAASAQDLCAQGGMTDDEVMEYVKNGIASGKEQKQIGLELLSLGVTKEQAKRVRKMYELRNGSHIPEPDAALPNRLRELSDEFVNEWDVAQQVTDSISVSNVVYGRNIFNTRNLTFEPNVNLATPPNYRLGPGDEVIIDIWGASQSNIREIISPDGTINLNELGPVYLSGMTVTEADNFLRKELGKLYSNEDNRTKLTLGRARTIQVNIMGEVLQPGTYSLSAFSTLFHALYRAGGVNDIGSLRDVRLTRGGKVINRIDVYDFMLTGKVNDDIRLEEGDVIIVPAYSVMVLLTGKVKRPMKYELKEGESVADLIKYAGGFESDAFRKSLRISRSNGEEYEVKTVDEKDYAVCGLKDGDEVVIGAIVDRFRNRVEIEGAVYRPDVYELGNGVGTLKDLIVRAGGLMDDAFLSRGVLQRRRDDLTSEMLSFNVGDVMSGKAEDIVLHKDDVVYIPSIHDLEDMGDVIIMGEIAAPGHYTYFENMTVEDLIIRAGGLLDAASTVRVDVSRRIKDPTSISESDTIGRMYSFKLKDGFVIDGEPGFVLQPYDQVNVRRSPGYEVQKNVTVTGEVIFAGPYVMTRRSERISDLIAKAGGLTNAAYIKGARLIRIANDDEKKRMADVLDLMGRELGTRMLDSLGMRVQDTFSIGIDLEAALRNPGGDADLIVREGDILDVPAYSNTVRICGAVMMANSVSYLKNKSVGYYIDRAGGYSQHAKKNMKFIIYMNGNIKKVKGNGAGQIEPGCEIVVPSRKSREFGNVLSNILGYTTSIASLGVMGASIANMVR